MTLKEQRAIEALPKVGYRIGEAMKEAGYAETTQRSGEAYARIRKLVAKAYDPEVIKADIRKAEQDFAKAGDNSNRARMIELRAKVCGLGRDTNTNQVNIISDSAIKGIKNDITNDVSST